MFVVIEGLDGAGTTTQAHRLCERLRAEGEVAQFTCEPSGGPVGSLIRQMLSMRVVAPTADGVEAVGRETLALLFAADRMDHVRCEIEPALTRGAWVVSDRYYHSSFAYQGDVDGRDTFDVEWVRTLNARARRPDVTFFLRADVDLCLSRMIDRGRRDIYETREKLERLAARYDQVMELLSGDGETIVELDASRPIEELSDAIYERLTRA